MSAQYYIQVALSLAVFAAILYGIIVLSQNVQKKKFRGELKLIDRLPLSTSVSMVVVRCRQKEYVLTVSKERADVIDQSDVS